MNRRDFIHASLVSSGGMLVSTCPFAFASETDFHPIESIKQKANASFYHSTEIVDPGLTRRQWQTIAVVQEHLFPSQKNAPGAKEVNSKAYLYAVLADKNRDEDDRKLVKQGLIELQDICWKKHHLSFDKLTTEQQEISLRDLEQTPQGRPWIMTILGYIFEALLVDPVYGGNPNMIGWQWLEHQAGFPRPSAASRYFLL